jgi:hypothetical protein
MKTLHYLAAAGLALSLAACGGSSSSNTPVAMTPDPAPSPMADAFYTLVAAQVGATSEEGEPREIETIVVTSPDGNEPTPI